MTEALDLEPATIPVRYARETIARLRVSAAARERVVDAAGIVPAVLRTTRGRLTAVQFARLHRGAVRASGDESLGYATHPTPLGSFAFLVRSLTRCPDVAACIEQASAFYRLFDPSGGWDVEAGPTTTTIRLRPRGPTQASSVLWVHSMLLTPSRTAAWLTGNALPLTAVELPERFRAFAGETRFLFGLAPTFGRGVGEIRFPSRQLALPVIRGPQDVEPYLRGSLRGFLLGAAGDDVERRVRRVLAEGTPFAASGVDQVARRLGMSRPTLARHLQRIGTSFAALRDELRRDFAIGLLGRGLKVAEVSERLGYSEPSAFHRAFRAWTGSAPGSYAVRAGTRPPRGGDAT